MTVNKEIGKSGIDLSITHPGLLEQMEVSNIDYYQARTKENINKFVHDACVVPSESQDPEDVQIKRISEGVSSTYLKAKDEFAILKETTPNAVALEFEDEILALVNKFGNSGQSGGSAPYTAAIISKAVKELCLQQPLGDITGVASEWNPIRNMGTNDDMSLCQNKRCSALFKNGDADDLSAPVHYLDAIVFQGEDKWDTFTGRVEDISSSWVIKEFPFKPKTFYIDVYRELYDPIKHGGQDECRIISCRTGDFVYFIKDRSQLDAVYAYYEKPYTEKLS